MEGTFIDFSSILTKLDVCKSFYLTCGGSSRTSGSPGLTVMSLKVWNATTPDLIWGMG